MQPALNKYTVIWLGEVQAEDHVNAAKAVFSAFHDPTPYSAIFDVAREDGEILTINLVEEQKKLLSTKLEETNPF